jgi:hypothetical protein
VRLWVDPALAEEAVFERMRVLEAESHPDVRRWQLEREALYAANPERRKADFEAFAERWFEHLGLTRPLSAALAATPHARTRLSEVRVHRAVRRAHEGSELYQEAQSARLVFGLTPRRFARPQELAEFFLRECLYAEDMLDPEWGYAPRLHLVPGEEPVHAELVRDRLRVLWQARVRGRMERQLGRAQGAPPGKEFLQAFGESEPASAELAELHARVVAGELADYAALLAAARAPATVPAR